VAIRPGATLASQARGFDHCGFDDTRLRRSTIKSVNDAEVYAMVSRDTRR
jgi:hypothetical protein